MHTKGLNVNKPRKRNWLSPSAVYTLCSRCRCADIGNEHCKGISHKIRKMDDPLRILARQSLDSIRNGGLHLRVFEHGRRLLTTYGLNSLDAAFHLCPWLHTSCPYSLPSLLTEVFRQGDQQVILNLNGSYDSGCGPFLDRIFSFLTFSIAASSCTKTFACKTFA